MRRRRTFIHLPLAMGVVVVGVLTLLFPASPAVAAPRPNVVLIVADDLRWDQLAFLPWISRSIAGPGVTFENAFVVNPICCPSRASILTGRYSHSTGVYRQSPPFGRWETFDDSSTIATWLQDAGYETGLFGKYLDGYQHGALTSYVPPGWSEFAAFVRSGYTDYALTVNGVVERYGDGEDAYATDVLAGKAAAFVGSARAPFFLYFAPPAPHAPATPPARYANKPAPSTRQAPPPSLDEEDISDKPSYMRDVPPLGPSGLAAQEELRADQFRSMLAVDDAVGSVVDAVAERGELARTVFILTSDNGLLRGEHRWRGKEVPYEESIRVPLVIRSPGSEQAAGRTDSRLALNIDLAPTIAELAGAPAAPTDGTSLVPLLRDDEPATWRSDFLIEHLEGTTPVPTYCATRSRDTLYVAYDTGEEELYDLAADPFQLDNVVNDPAYRDLHDARRARLVELCSPRPPGFAFAATGQRTWIGIAGLGGLLIVAALIGRRQASR